MKIDALNAQCFVNFSGPRVILIPKTVVCPSQFNRFAYVISNSILCFLCFDVMLMLVLSGGKLLSCFPNIAWPWWLNFSNTSQCKKCSSCLIYTMNIHINTQYFAALADSFFGSKSRASPFPRLFSSAMIFQRTTTKCKFLTARICIV